MCKSRDSFCTGSLASVQEKRKTCSRQPFPPIQQIDGFLRVKRLKRKSSQKCNLAFGHKILIQAIAGDRNANQKYIKD